MSAPTGVLDELAPRFSVHLVTTPHMEPELSIGDLVQIDTTVTKIDGDAVYLIAFPGHGEPALRRIAQEPGGRCAVTCDSAPEAVHRCARADLMVIGRAVQAMRGRPL